jgi:hypothetical protein
VLEEEGILANDDRMHPSAQITKVASSAAPLGKRSVTLVVGVFRLGAFFDFIRREERILTSDSETLEMRVLKRLASPSLATIFTRG